MTSGIGSGHDAGDASGDLWAARDYRATQDPVQTAEKGDRGKKPILITAMVPSLPLKAVALGKFVCVR